MGDLPTGGVPSPVEDISYTKNFRKLQQLAEKERLLRENQSENKSKVSETVSTELTGNMEMELESGLPHTELATPPPQGGPPTATTQPGNPSAVVDVTDVPMMEFKGTNHPTSQKEDVVMSHSTEPPPSTDRTTIPVRTPISYKSMLVGEDERNLDQDFDELVKEWLQEERTMTPSLSADQMKLLDTIPKVSISDDRLKELCRPWKDALVVTLVGRNTNLNMMRDRLVRLLRSDNFEIVDLPNNHFVFKSGDKTLCKKLLFEGPWVIQGHYLAVQRWSPNFNPYCNRSRKVAIWVRIPTLPIHMYSADLMWELGNLIGKALKVDINTLAQRDNNKNEVARAKFARVSVEVDLNKKLLARIQVRSKVYPVEYEGLNAICFKCGLYGHNQEGCPLLAQSTTETPATMAEGSQTKVGDLAEAVRQPLMTTPGVRLEDEYGDWMKVKPFLRKKNPKPDTEKNQQTATQKNPTPQPTSLTGSRFDVLTTDETNFVFNARTDDTHKKGSEKKWKKKEERETYPNRDDHLQVPRTAEGWSAPDFLQPNGKRNDSPAIKLTNQKDVETLTMATPRTARGTGSNRKSRKGSGKTTSQKPDGVESGDPTELDLGSTQSPSKGLALGKKRASITRPKLTSPLLRSKQSGRAHQLVFGSMSCSGPLDFKKTKVDQCEQVEIVGTHMPQQASPRQEVNVGTLPSHSAMTLIPSPQETEPPDPLHPPPETVMGPEPHYGGDEWYDPQEMIKEDSLAQLEAAEISDSGQ